MTKAPDANCVECRQEFRPGTRETSTIARDNPVDETRQTTSRFAQCRHLGSLSITSARRRRLSSLTRDRQALGQRADPRPGPRATSTIDGQMLAANPSSDIRSPVAALLIRSTVDRFGDHLRLSDGGRIERRAPPGNIDGQTRKIDDTSVATVTTQVVRCAHEDTVDRTRLNAKRTKHALRVVNRIAGNAETLCRSPLAPCQCKCSRPGRPWHIGRTQCRSSNQSDESRDNEQRPGPASPDTQTSP